MNRNEFDTFYADKRKEKPGWAANPDELWGIVSALHEIEVNNVLEIGIQRGDSLDVWDRVVGPRAKLVGVDLYNNVKDKVYTNEFILILGNSQDPDTFAGVKDHMPVVDFLFIDGEHYGDGPRKDWETYSPLVRSGGIIALHDTNGVEVKKVFDSITYRKQNYSRAENYSYEYGTGVVWKT